MPELHHLFAPVPLGLEAALADELRALRAGRVRARRAGVSFIGDLEGAARALMWTRVASRLLIRIAEVEAPSAQALYESVRAVSWEDHLSVTGTFAVDVVASRSPLTHTGYATLKVKDAIVDRLRDRSGGVRPSVDTVRPDVRVNVALKRERAVVSIDLGGAGLHRRGYRGAGERRLAPLKENVAAGALMLAKWPRIAGESGAFFDPMCGSGTLVLEAAMIACDVAPGLGRGHTGMHGWLGSDPAAYERVIADARERAAAGIEAVRDSARSPRFLGTDADRHGLELALTSAMRMGLAGVVGFDRHDVRTARPPREASRGLVALNPPYGARLGAHADLRALYAAAGERLAEVVPGWSACVISGARDLIPFVGLDVEGEHSTYNGRIPVTVAVGRVRARGAKSAESNGVARHAVPALPTNESAGVRQFVNRLRKNARHIGSWARGAGVSCYRVYDADLAEYAFAIDLYHGAGPDVGRMAVHMAEYAPPATVDPVRADRRRSEALAAVSETLGVPLACVHLKVRRRQRGALQYSRHAATGRTMTVSEAGLFFEVNLSDYLDTGLFLHHRPARSLVREMAAGARFLNLFAYTGAASVYAASGAAASTLTVDLSRTYLEWAARNMALNGLESSRNSRARADVLAWLQSDSARSAGPFDLVFCDPPTFSNSARMERAFDVQRDHAALIGDVLPLVASGGTLFFSTNRRAFTLDEAALRTLSERYPIAWRDVTAGSIPLDFKRTPRVHTLVRIERAAKSAPRSARRS